nr:ROK family protein [Streptomyces sp. V4I2]
MLRTRSASVDRSQSRASSRVSLDHAADSHKPISAPAGQGPPVRAGTTTPLCAPASGLVDGYFACRASSLALGEVFRGADGAVGAVGHIRAVGGGDALCGCGNVGCVSALARTPPVPRPPLSRPMARPGGRVGRRLPTHRPSFRGRPRHHPGCSSRGRADLGRKVPTEQPANSPRLMPSSRERSPWLLVQPRRGPGRHQVNSVKGGSGWELCGSFCLCRGCWRGQASAWVGRCSVPRCCGASLRGCSWHGNGRRRGGSHGVRRLSRCTALSSFVEALAGATVMAWRVPWCSTPTRCI